jgi:hypothetical protein
MAAVTHRRGKTMTTITTGASGPQAWKIALVAGAVGLATLVAVNLPQTTSDTTGEQVAQTATATLPESVTGFEYNNESTAGQVVIPGVTTPYPGYSGELMPYENGLAPAQAPTGFSGPVPQASLDEGLIDRIVGGTTQVAPTPDNLADAQSRVSVPIPANANAEAGTTARWGALHGAYHNETLSGYTARSAEPNPADRKFLEGQPAAAPQTEPNPADRKFLEGQPAAAPQTEPNPAIANNQIR